MGMYVSQLRSVPVGVYEYYVYLVDSSRNAIHSEEIGRAFQHFAVESGTDAVIVRGPPDLSYELFQFLQTHANSDFSRLETLFHEATCLLISEGSLQTTKTQVFVIPLVECEAPAPGQRPLIDQLLASLLRAMRSHALAEFCSSLGAREMKLTEISGGLIVATLRKMNEALELKPNIAGLGVNLNAILQRILGPSERPLPE